jgi:predicted O-methyltransferase YrrM
LAIIIGRGNSRLESAALDAEQSPAIAAASFHALNIGIRVMDPHFAESKKLAEDIEGMMSPFSMAVVDSLLAFQQVRGITGDVLEMGVYHGKSAAILGRRMSSNETLHLYDIADYFDRKNLERAGANIRYNIANTERLYRWNLRKQKKSIRFCHIDASHMFNPTIHEISIADYVLAKDGIVCLDDYTNLNYSQILAATFKYLFTKSTNLTMFLVTAEKAYLCRRNAFPIYGQFVLDEIRSQVSNRGVNPCLGSVWIQDSHPGLIVIQAWNGPIRFD